MSETKVLYNAECPVCNFEISHYARHAKERNLTIQFEDLNASDLGSWGLTPDQAAQRLYVRKGTETLSGIDGFLALWCEMPKYRWLARVVGCPGIRQVAVWVYDRQMAPLIYRWHLRRRARTARV